jgi:hypothetical protein
VTWLTLLLSFLGALAGAGLAAWVTLRGQPT